LFSKKKPRTAAAATSSQVVIELDDAGDVAALEAEAVEVAVCSPKRKVASASYVPYSPDV
jgi:uncharacterized protein YuzE